MSENFALDYIPRRMRELGHGSDYYTKFRHLQLSASEERNINAYNQIYLLLDEPTGVAITSEFGAFDLSSTSINEQGHEHQGLINIKNNMVQAVAIRFIQIIPKHK